MQVIRAEILLSKQLAGCISLTAGNDISLISETSTVATVYNNHMYNNKRLLM